MSSYYALVLILALWALAKALGAYRRRVLRARAKADVEDGRHWVVREAARWGAERYEARWSMANANVSVDLFGPGLSLTVSVTGKATRAQSMYEAARILGVQREEMLAGADTHRRESAAGPAPQPPRPAPARAWWRESLGIGDGADLAEATAAWRGLAKRHHPDLGGSADAMAGINRAMDEARKVLA